MDVKWCLFCYLFVILSLFLLIVVSDVTDRCIKACVTLLNIFNNFVPHLSFSWYLWQNRGGNWRNENENWMFRWRQDTTWQTCQKNPCVWLFCGRFRLQEKLRCSAIFVLLLGHIAVWDQTWGKDLNYENIYTAVIN